MGPITISRELGSEGDKIADLLCQQLGYHRVDKMLLAQLAGEAGVDIEDVLAKEKSVTTKPKFVSSEMKSLYRKQPSAFDDKRTQQGVMNDQTYRQILHETMESFAQTGNVIIVGRGGNMVLQDWPSALHLRLYAPPEIRIQCLMDRFDISEAEAARRIKISDEEKRQYIRYMHQNADWAALKYYHLAINTHEVKPDIAAQIIMLAAQAKAREQPS